MNRLLSIGIILLFLGLSISSSTGFNVEKQSIPLDGKTLYVGGNGPGNYTKIQDAIDNSSDGDTVFVYNDSSPYEEYLDINKSINLIGENRDTTEIYYWDEYTITITADWINISGFKLSNYNVPLIINSSYNNISNNYFKGDEWGGYIGIEISNDKNNNIISNNIIEGYGLRSIHITNFCSNTTISKNKLFNNWHDIVIENSCHNTTIIGNEILNTGCCAVIDIRNSNNNIIADNYITPDWIHGIELHNSHYNSVYNNTIIGNKICLGIELTNSKENNIFDNTMIGSGLTIWNTSQNNVANNTVSYKPLVYLENTSDLIIPGNNGQVVLINCNNITVQNQQLSNTSEGVSLWNTTNCSISNNLFFNNNLGIKTSNSNDNTISGNVFNNGGSIKFSNSQYNTIIDNNITNSSSIRLGNSHHNVIIDNFISKNSRGIVFTDSQYNSIKDNTITDGYMGIELQAFDDHSNYNKITKNIISNQNSTGIYIWSGCWNNIIYHNNFINNKRNAEAKGSNIWDNDYPSGGNYWDDYTGNDSNGDGIGDTPYPIPGGYNKDRYPLMKPFGSNQPPTVRIVNPWKGYIHFFGIPLFSTPLDLIAETFSVGGFRFRPIQINAKDNDSDGNQLKVTLLINDEDQGPGTWNPKTGHYEWKWTERTIGNYNFRVRAEDIHGETSDWESMFIWNFCLL